MLDKRKYANMKEFSLQFTNLPMHQEVREHLTQGGFLMSWGILRAKITKAHLI